MNTDSFSNSMNVTPKLMCKSAQWCRRQWQNATASHHQPSTKQSRQPKDEIFFFIRPTVGTFQYYLWSQGSCGLDNYAILTRQQGQGASLDVGWRALLGAPVGSTHCLLQLRWVKIVYRFCSRSLWQASVWHHSNNLHPSHFHRSTIWETQTATQSVRQQLCEELSWGQVSEVLAHCVFSWTLTHWNGTKCCTKFWQSCCLR